MTPQEIYQSRAERFAARESEWSGRSYRLSNWRLTAFLSGFVFGIIASVGVQDPGWMAALFGLSMASFVGFAILVIKHRKVSREQNRFRLLKELNGFGEHRLNRAWDQFPVPAAPAHLQQLPEARDLDLFGKASLFHLVSTQQTPQGRASLAHWLAESAPAGKLSERQEAVESLSPHIDWRQNLAVIGEDLAIDEAVVIPRWFGKETWLGRHENLNHYLRFAAWISLGSLLLFVLFSPLPIFMLPLFLLPFGFHAFLIRKHRLEIKRSLDDLAEEDRTIRCYAEIFDHLKECPSNSGLLSTLIPQISEARSAMDQLNAITTWAAARGSLVHPLFNAFFALDLQTVGRLEKWQERYRDHFHGWFEALGEIEALASLASLHHDEPGWARPEFRESGKLIASELGHPLIKQAVRVGNDVSLGPEGRFLLVTGSNMAGKSTLLRAIGLNTILARCGAPVCARSMITPPLTIATSMEIQDSLADGLSFFMAELKRIKEVVHLAIQEREEGRTLLFLFDEILQGTNSIERREIVQRVLANLVGNGAMGAVTTHDLALAESDELTRNADLIHFREHFQYNADGKPEMTFDYQVRPGVATTTNALKILEVIEMPV